MFFENSLFIVVGNIEQIAMGQRAIGVSVKQPRCEIIKEAAEKFSARLIWPSAAAKPDELVVSEIQTDRATDQETCKPERSFRKGQRADQAIDDVEFIGVAPNITRRAITKDSLPPGRDRA